MRRFARLTLIAALAALATPAAAIEPAEGEAIRGVIGSQLEAFQADDGARAYDFAAPLIQEMFPSADRFMEMVRQSYAPVYRPRSVTFGELMETPLGPAQKVYLTGPDGGDYVAVYTLERQPDGTWKITGCFLARDTRPSV
jgi:hypothetical protein